MMRGRIRRLVVCGAVTGLLAAGAAGATMELAHADTPVTSCDGFQSATGTAYKCTVATGTATSISDPSAITVSVTDDTSGYTEAVVINYTVNCTDTTNGELQTAGSPTEQTPVTLNLSLPASADGTCTVSATVTSPSTASDSCPAPSGNAGPSPSPSPSASACPDDFTASLSYTAATSPTPTPSSTSSAPAVHPVKGFDGKCMDDKGNSSANRAQVVIWSCSGSDQAENWTFSSNELKHNGKCLNDQGNGGSRSKVILWTCNGAANEKWSELANGELRLQSHGNTLCVDDPRSSTKNGTQLIVYGCSDNANQKWSLP
jgi:Ricin-type beta-trefoil lectin domain